MLRRPQIDLARVAPEHREEALELLRLYEATVAANPLEVFEPHSEAQAEFLSATTPIVAAFAGNQFGKSTILMVRMLIELLSRADVPEHLRKYKRFEAPTHMWALCPTEDKVFDSLKPALEKWCPPSTLKGGNWRKAFNGERMQISFENGSTLTFKTYKQDASTLGGATLHGVGFDEPPPRAHRDEAATRLLQFNGHEWYAMTPLKANTGWIRREIWRNREAPHITVVKGGMRDNPTLSPDAIERLLSSYANDLWRRAREFGDFMDIAGLVYADIERIVVPPPPPSMEKQFIAGLEHVVGIDPGIRNAAFIFGGFDSHGVDWIYDEELVQNGTPSQYAAVIDRKLKRWGLRRSDVLFVIDPAARQRSQATGDTVQSELARLGIYTMNGVNDREVGQQNIRDRILHRRIQIFNTCVGILDDADEFAWEMEDDDDHITGAADDSPFHRLATLRYQVMTRPFYPSLELKHPSERNLGRMPNQALDLRYLQPASGKQHGPMGPLS